MRKAISVCKVDSVLTDFAQCCTNVSSLPPENFSGTGLTTEL